MFFKKENELDFACQSCANCCRYFNINITHLDIKRILENRPDLTSNDFVYFTQSDPKEDESESFISTYGKRDISLKKKPNSQDCVFLDEKNMCSIHDFKPIVCRVWPFSLEKGKISWIKEHHNFIKKICKHTSVKGANDPDKLREVLKLHSKERKIYSKLVKIWNNEKQKEVDSGELFLDILDEDFLQYILKELNVQKQAEVEEEDNFYQKIISYLIKDRKIELITESKIDQIYNHNKRIDLNLYLYLQDQYINEFFEYNNIENIKEFLKSKSITNEKTEPNYSIHINKKIISFLLDKKIVYLHLKNFDESKKPLFHDTKIIYNPYGLNLTIQKFKESKNEALINISKTFPFKVTEALFAIKNENFIEAKLIINSILQEELLPLVYWLNKKTFKLKNLSKLKYRNENLEIFIKEALIEPQNIEVKEQIDKLLVIFDELFEDCKL